MKRLFTRLWALIKGFFSKLLHIGKKELKEAAEDMREQIEKELEEISKAIETATEEELAHLQARALLLRSKLIDMVQQSFDKL